MRGGRWRTVRFPALCALLDHPDRGPVLIDTGYAPRVRGETRRWPAWLYGALIPVHVREADTAAAQLRALGIAPEAIETVVLTHFHADHVAGLRDFRRARFVFAREAYEAVRSKRGVAAVKAGFLPGLLPDDFEARAEPLDPRALRPLPAPLGPFRQGIDVLGDGGLWGLPLPGHAVGQMGLYFKHETGRPVLLAADACWLSRQVRERRYPSRLAHLVLPDPAAYRDTLDRLHELHRARPDVAILPSHCPEVWENRAPR